MARANDFAQPMNTVLVMGKSSCDPTVLLRKPCDIIAHLQLVAVPCPALSPCWQAPCASDVHRKIVCLTIKCWSLVSCAALCHRGQALVNGEATRSPSGPVTPSTTVANNATSGFESLMLPCIAARRCYQETGLPGGFAQDFIATWQSRAQPVAQTWAAAQEQWVGALRNFEGTLVVCCGCTCVSVVTTATACCTAQGSPQTSRSRTWSRPWPSSFGFRPWAHPRMDVCGGPWYHGGGGVDKGVSTVCEAFVNHRNTPDFMRLTASTLRSRGASSPSRALCQKSSPACLPHPPRGPSNVMSHAAALHRAWHTHPIPGGAGLDR